jgi:3-hydroxybutyryl-CoA dehydrogenase
VDTVLVDRDDLLAATAGARILAAAAAAESAGRTPSGHEQSVSARLTVGAQTSLLSDCDLVVEAVPEVLGVKHAVLADVEAVVSDRTVFATNTSSIPIADLARGARCPGRVVGVHFFNPVDRMPLVEVTPALLTDPEVVKACSAFLRDVLGKSVIQATDRAGFVVNALLVPYLLSAIRMLEAGVATAEDIDTGMVAGCGHPMGPLVLSDLIGLDVVCDVADTLHAEYGEQQLAAPPLLRRMVASGLLGRKTGRGFHHYAARAAGSPA